jgi:predicted Zn-dependent protease
MSWNPVPPREQLEATLERLIGSSLRVAELYVKTGKSVRWSWRAGEGLTYARSLERGFAVRAGVAHRSGFWVQAERPPETLDLASLGPGRLDLPGPQPTHRSFRRGVEDFTFLPESACEWFEGVKNRMEEAMSQVEWLRAELEMGSSVFSLLSSTGVWAEGTLGVRRLKLELLWGDAILSYERPFVDSNGLRSEGIVEELVERFQALERGTPRDRRLRWPVVVRASVMARLVEALATAENWLRPDRSMVRRWSPDGGSSPFWSVVHDGGDPRGPVASLWDGEGKPTSRGVLVEQGLWVGGRRGEALFGSGCVRRDSYRDKPRPGFLQLFLEPVPGYPQSASQGASVPGSSGTEPSGPVLGLLFERVPGYSGSAPGYSALGTSRAELEEELEDGAVLIAAEGRVCAVPEGRFRLKTTGFWVQGGKRRGGLGPVLLEGSFEALRCGLRRLASDLEWVPGDGVFGAPSALLEGLELVFP